MAQSKNLFVYYDPDYDPNRVGSWIKPWISTLIVQFLTQRNFQIVNAVDLRTKMLSVIERKEEKMVIVFAQDIAPDTVLDDISPTALIRQYLDNGGSVVWVGDIPFYYQTREHGHDQDNDWWKKGAPANILGVNPTSAPSPQTTNITTYGENRGLTTPWTGIRPILLSKGTKVLAATKSDLCVPYAPVTLSGISRFFNRLKGIKFSLAQISLSFEIDTLDYKIQERISEENTLFNKKLANGWSKNFNDDYPNSGFIRIWDYSPRALSPQQLNDLYNLALSTIKDKEIH